MKELEYVIIGTAGHVDHGKTQLVKALTGVDTDRLKEEKERGISIELGFAPLTLPDGARVGLVDVPGHERFIRQMLAGVAGMDLVMLVVAADEGVMPQTREHLDIIHLLQVKRGILVVSKIDLVDPEWLALVQEEIREAVQGTVLADAPMVAVSALTGEGIPILMALLTQMVNQTPARTASGKMRLPVDRVFSITGFGTVVTGTLWSGTIKTGEQVEVLPAGILCRVRSIQVHGLQVTEAVAGQRVAVNLAGVEVADIPRGNVLTQPGLWRATHRLDVQLHLLKSVGQSITHQERVRFYLGTDEAFGRVFLLDREEVLPGETVFAQLVMETPVVCQRHDRFVLRHYSPLYTIGGGRVIDPHPPKHKRHQASVMAALAAKSEGTSAELVVQALGTWRHHPATLPGLAETAGLPVSEVASSLAELQESGEVVAWEWEGEMYAASREHWQRWSSELQIHLAGYHRQYPLRPGLPKEELRTRYFGRVPPKPFQALLEGWQRFGLITLNGSAAALPEFAVNPTATQQDLLAKMAETCRQAQFQPPSWPELQESLNIAPGEGEELLHHLLRQETLVKIGEDLLFHREAVQRARELLREYGKTHGGFQLGEARDLLGSSRKYVLPLLEYFDLMRYTRRIGDKRVVL